MLVTTVEVLPGKEYEVLGMVKGSTVRAKHIGTDILAGLKNLVGGEIEGYTKMLEDARQQALERMILEATHLGADAVIGVRFVTAEVMQGAAEILAYGTAIKFKK